MDEGKIMKKMLVGVLALLALSASEALAAGPNLNHCIFTFLAPSTNTDGSPLTNLNGFKIKIGVTPGGPYTTVFSFPAGQSNVGTTVTTSNLCGSTTDGQKYAIATTTNTAGSESAPSNEVPFVLTTVAPAAINNLNVQ
jgi:hypothetical protein